MNSVEILYEDKYMLAVLKPAGMIVNKADTAKGNFTLQDFSEERIDILSKSDAKFNKDVFMVNGYNKYDEFISRGGIVHRLDKETSGIILIAKNPEVFIALQNQFKEKTVKKKYLTLVHGRLPEKEGTINAPIGRLPWNRMRFGVLPEGRSAITKYHVLEEFDGYSLLEIFPETGRTHQIRVHMQHIGHPIFADALYAGRKTARDDRRKLGRHFLHASEISFQHPITHEHHTLEAILPEDVSRFLAEVKKKS